jgi:hypothetical protein
VVLFKLLSTFGPLPGALVEHVDDKKAREVLTGVWQVIVENEINDNLSNWPEDVLDDDAKRLILQMTSLDPSQRAQMSDIVTDTYWNVEPK